MILLCFVCSSNHRNKDWRHFGVKTVGIRKIRNQDISGYINFNVHVDAHRGYTATQEMQLNMYFVINSVSSPVHKINMEELQEFMNSSLSMDATEKPVTYSMEEAMKKVKTNLRCARKYDYKGHTHHARPTHILPHMYARILGRCVWKQPTLCSLTEHCWMQFLHYTCSYLT